MTDKVQKIRKEVVEIINNINQFIPDEDGKNSDYEAGKLDMATQILQIIDSLEEPVSEDLEEAADQYLRERGYILTSRNGEHLAEVEAKTLFKAGAKWMKSSICHNEAEHPNNRH